MKILLLFFTLSIATLSFGQANEKLTTIEFVEIINNNNSEAIYYFQNNWQVLRELAIKKEYIDSYQLLEVPSSKEYPFQIMLITTYKNKAEYDLREDHFTELIKEKGPLRLLNDKKPGDFRKSSFSKDMVRHWN